MCKKNGFLKKNKGFKEGLGGEGWKERIFQLKRRYYKGNL
jgi:hypothetical protein